MNKKILFITWDGPQTNYLESLFIPIFEGLQQTGNWEFHIIQFSWAERDKWEQLSALTKDKGIVYTHFPVIRKPHPLIGSLWTLSKGIGFIKRYIKLHGIQILMPRSTLPATMTLSVKKTIPGIKVVFDADGLPLEERVDFSGLNPNGLQYRFLKHQETTMLKKADLVLVRSEKARQIHLKNIGDLFAPKIFKVGNGRDEDFFKPDPVQREKYRKKLNLSPRQLLLVYCGSLGPQYGLETMLSLFETLLQSLPDSRFLFLTQEDAYLKARIPEPLTQKIHTVNEAFSSVPSWLNAADLALSIREPSFSMQGVAPIKLGEYLLMGLPTIASKGIGDTESILEDSEFVHLFDQHRAGEMQIIEDWLQTLPFSDKAAIRKFALKHFSLERSIGDYKNALGFLVDPE